VAHIREIGVSGPVSAKTDSAQGPWEGCGITYVSGSLSIDVTTKPYGWDGTVDLLWTPERSVDTLVVLCSDADNPVEVRVRIDASELEPDIDLTLVANLGVLYFMGAQVPEGSTRATARVSIIGEDAHGCFIMAHPVSRTKDYAIVGVGTTIRESYTDLRALNVSGEGTVVRLSAVIGRLDTTFTQAPLLFVGSHCSLGSTEVPPAGRSKLCLSYTDEGRPQFSRSVEDKESRHGGLLSMYCYNEAKAVGFEEAFLRVNSLDTPLTKWVLAQRGYLNVSDPLYGTGVIGRSTSSFLPLTLPQLPSVSTLDRLLGEADPVPSEELLEVQRQQGTGPKFEARDMPSAKVLSVLDLSTEVYGRVASGAPFLKTILSIGGAGD